MLWPLNIPSGPPLNIKYPCIHAFPDPTYSKLGLRLRDHAVFFSTNIYGIWDLVLCPRIHCILNFSLAYACCLATTCICISASICYKNQHHITNSAPHIFSLAYACCLATTCICITASMCYKNQHHITNSAPHIFSLAYACCRSGNYMYYV